MNNPHAAVYGANSFVSSQKFATLTPASSCTNGEQACVNDQFAQCVNGKFVLQPCGAGTMYVSLLIIYSHVS